MNETWAIALFGIAFAILGAIVKDTREAAKEAKSLGDAMRLDVVRLQTQFEDYLKIVTTRDAKLLHSPDDHLELDALIDEYTRLINEYQAPRYDLPDDHWLKLQAVALKLAEKCRLVGQNPTASKFERVYAEAFANTCETLVARLCQHKMGRDRLTHTSKLIT